MSPLNEPRDPVNENMGNGTGIGTLIPTWKIFGGNIDNF